MENSFKTEFLPWDEREMVSKGLEASVNFVKMFKNIFKYLSGGFNAMTQGGADEKPTLYWALRATTILRYEISETN